MNLAQSSDAISWQRASAFNPLFEVKDTSDRHSGWVRNIGQLRGIVSSVLSAKAPATASRRYSVKKGSIATGAVARGIPTLGVGDSEQKVVGESWLSAAMATLALPEGWMHVVNEIREYAALETEWRGPGTKSVPEEIGLQAEVLARSFAEQLPDGIRPMIGADDEGYVVMTWDEGDLVGNLSVRGKGLYSYYIRRGGNVAKSARATIGLPLAEELVDALKP